MAAEPERWAIISQVRVFSVRVEVEYRKDGARSVMQRNESMGRG
jgi:hypothetical protein